MAACSMALFMAVTPGVFAEDLPPRLALDRVFFQVSLKQWVTTQTALLSVSINATLTSADLVKARTDIMGRLSKIAKGDWHLLEFQRSQDSSGLEKLYVQAQARVDQSALTGIYQNAKSVSMPGAKYEISGVEFKPSLEETQTVKANIRELLYQKVSDEIARINKVYPAQHYTVGNLLFVDGDSLPLAKAYQAKELNTMSMAAVSAPLTVSNELVLTAVVEAASTREGHP
ncbi:MAG: hypothetical protein ACHP65_07930 [Legionellales bacterium]